MPSPLVAPRGFEFGTAAAVPEAVLSAARAEASSVGYAHGWAQGIREARETQQALQAASAAKIVASESQRDAELRSALDALFNAATGRSAANDSAVQMQAEQVLEAAFQIAEALVGVALKLPEFAAPAALTRVLAEAPAAEPVTVRMNPYDRSVLTGAGGSQLMSQIAGAAGRQLTIEGDPTIGRGDAIATYGDTTIDGRIAAGIDRVRERLAQ